MTAFLTSKIAGAFLLVIPLLFLVLISFMLRDVEKSVVVSLGLLRRYDDHIKSKLHLVYEPASEKEKPGFIERVKSELEKSGYYGMVEKHNKDIRDLFKH